MINRQTAEETEALQFIIDELQHMLLNGNEKRKRECYNINTPVFNADIYLRRVEEQKMSNEEINVLINLHLAELENNSEVVRGEASRERLIKALKQATEIIANK